MLHRASSFPCHHSDSLCFRGHAVTRPASSSLWSLNPWWLGGKLRNRLAFLPHFTQLFFFKRVLFSTFSLRREIKPCSSCVPVNYFENGNLQDVLTISSLPFLLMYFWSCVITSPYRNWLWLPTVTAHRQGLLHNCYYWKHHLDGSVFKKKKVNLLIDFEELTV